MNTDGKLENTSCNQSEISLDINFRYENEPIKTGYLLMKNFWGIWKEKWATLDSKVLKFYQSNANPVIVEEYRLFDTNAYRVEVADHLTQKPNTLMLSIENNKPVYIMGTNAIEWEEWKRLLMPNKNENSSFDYLSTIDAILDCIVICDENGIIVAWNKSAEKLFGYIKDEVLGENVNILMPAPFKGQHNNFMTAYKQFGQKTLIGVQRRLPAVKKDGTLILIELSLGEIKGTANSHFIATIREIVTPDAIEPQVITTIDKNKDALLLQVNSTMHKLEQDLKISIKELTQNMMEKYVILEEQLKSATTNLEKLKEDYIVEQKARQIAQNYLPEDKRFAVEVFLKAETSKKHYRTFLQIINNKKHFEKFLNFLTVERSTENLYFYQEVQKYRLNYPQNSRETAESIFNKFFEADSDFEINVDEIVKSNIQTNLKKEHPQKDIFDTALNHVLQNLYEDSFFRFLASPEGKAYTK